MAEFLKEFKAVKTGQTLQTVEIYEDDQTQAQRTVTTDYDEQTAPPPPPSGPSASDASLAFDGSNDYLHCGDSADLNITNDLTVAFFVNGGSQSGNKAFAYRMETGKAQWRIVTHGGTAGHEAKLTAELSKDGSLITKSYYTPGTILDNAWRHFAFTFKDGVLKIYQDGAYISNPGMWANQSMTTISSHANVPLILGAGFSGGGPIWNAEGRMRNSVIFNTALTDTEMTELFNIGRNGDINTHSKAANIKMLLPVRTDDTYPTIDDKVGSNDGTMTNMDAGDIEAD